MPRPRRMFNGRWYTLVKVTRSRSVAEKMADKQRSAGGFARITSIPRIMSGDTVVSESFQVWLRKG